MASAPKLLVLVTLLAACDLEAPPDLGEATASLTGPPIVQVDGGIVGTLPGTPSVSADGAARYSLALEVPPGRAGIEPRLTLEYSSRRGGTSLGVGWSLDETSQIGPCGSINGRDGELRPVQLAGRDHMCLDGTRLVKVAAAEWRVEADGGTRVTAISDAGGVTEWEVRTRDGLITSYGGPGSLIQSGSKRIAWLKRRVRDRSGNYMDFTHEVTTSPALEWRLTRISYTGLISPATAATRTIDFEYEARPDATERYLRGVKLGLSKRLKSITMKAPNPPEQTHAYVRKYLFGYEQGVLSQRSRLATVKLCATDTSCLPETRFRYQEAYPSFRLQALGAANVRDDAYSDKVLFATDVDGDGRDDLVYRSNNGQLDPGRDGIHVRKGTATGLGAALASAYPTATQLSDLTVFDLDGDDRVDLIGTRNERYCAALCGTQHADWRDRVVPYQYPSNGQGFGAGKTFTALDPEIQGPRPYHGFADMDGDLRPEILDGLEEEPVLDWVRKSPAWLALGHSNTALPANLGDGVRSELFRSTDLDGDGGTDLLLPYVAVHNPDNSGVLRYDLIQKRGSNLEAFATSLEARFLMQFDVGDDGLINGSRVIVVDAKCSTFADVNGDGLADLVDVKGAVRLRMNLGHGDFGPWQTALPGSTGYACSDNDAYTDNDPDPGLLPVDYNQDGRQDLLVLGAGTSATGRLLLSNGAGFTAPSTPLPFGGHDKVWATRTLDVNGDGLFDVAQLKPKTTGGPDLELYVQEGGHGDLLYQVEDGFAATVWRVTYAPLLGTGYAKSGACISPRRCVNSPGLVVTEERVPDATSAANAPANGTVLVLARTHEYAGARADTTGWGFLGFETHTTRDLLTGATKRVTYDQQQVAVAGAYRYPHVNQPREVLAWVKVGAIYRATRTATTHAVRESVVNGVALYVSYPATTEVAEYESSSFDPNALPAPFRRSVTTVDVDGHGNRILERVEQPGLASHTTQRSFKNDATSWLIGLTEQESFDSTRNGVAADVARSNSYSYDSLGRPYETRQDVQAQTKQRCTRVAARNPYGLVTRLEVTPGSSCAPVAGVTRVTRFGYEDGHYLVYTQNAALHESQQAFHPGLGVPTYAWDENNQRTAMQYDLFGRLVAVERPDGSSTRISRVPCGVYGMCVTTTDGDGRVVIDELDRLGQLVRTITRSVDNREIVTDVEYDRLGRRSADLHPRYYGEAIYVAARYQYDAVGRLVATCQHNQSLCETTSYDKLATVVTDEDGKQRRMVVDASGLLVESTVDPAGAALTTRYTYGPFGALTRVTDADGNVVTFQYDSRGNQVRIDDADLGWREMRYDAFGQLESVKDPKLQLATFTYDAVGRMLSRSVSVNGVVVPGDQDTWTWDPVGAKGRLARRERGAASTSFAYDDKARPITESWSIDGNVFDYGFAYDAKGRLDTLAYPLVSGRPRFTVKHVYGTRGHLRELKDASTTTHKRIWYLTNHMAWGAPRTEALGNQLVVSSTHDLPTTRPTQVTTTGVHDVSFAYSPGGNITSRTDWRNGAAAVARTETFGYDAANRLTSSSVTGRTPALHSYAYDRLGNVKTATDQPCTSYVYGGALGPHRLTSVTCSGVVRTRSYDANGNEIRTTWPENREQTWTSFDKIAEIASPYGRLRYTYDADHRRVKKAKITGAFGGASPLSPAPRDALSGVWDTTLYAGDGYERRQISGSSTVEHVFYVSAGGAPVAQLVWKEQPTAEQWLYFHRDPLGSVEKVTDGAGLLVSSASYDAWGQRRNPDWTSSAASTPPAPTRLGYTGHAHEDEFVGVIDMGGRTYDAAAKRFLSADPIVQMPSYGPSWNRYSYVLNNPMRYTDPTGHEAAQLDLMDMIAAFFTASAEAGTTSGGQPVQMTADGQVEVTALPEGVTPEMAAAMEAADAQSVDAPAYVKVENPEYGKKDSVIETLSAVSPVGNVVGKLIRGESVSAGDVIEAAMDVVPVGKLAGAVGKVVGKADDVVDAGKLLRAGDDAAGQAAHLTNKGGVSNFTAKLPKPPTGPGSVPKAARDPKRYFGDTERAAMRKAQGGECANGCGTKIDASNSAGHHIKRHADGGRTVPENHAEVCTGPGGCHGALHSK